MSRESNIVFVNWLAWAHALAGMIGAFKFGVGGELFGAGAWLIWAGLAAAFAMTAPRQITRKRGDVNTVRKISEIED